MEPRTVTALCADYPRGLGDLQPPPSLRVRGALRDGAAVAIVGAREASQPALDYARQLAFDLTRAGVSIWSGGALGIDAAAHRGALDAGGHTVVVLGGGLDRPSPPTNVALFEEVVQSGGAIVSIFEDDEDAARHRFLLRNRVLAAASGVLIVVECELQSGARNAARHARELGRTVAVCLQPPWSSRGRGCQLEHDDNGALALRGTQHALDLVAAAWPNAYGARPVLPTLQVAKKQLSFDDLALAEEEIAIVRAVDQGAADLDALCAALDAAPGIVSARVLDLVLRGVIEQSHQGLRLASAAACLQSPGLPSRSS